MHRACTRLRQRNPNLFIVESLFANNEQGAWYDPSDMNTLFQDDAGTIPVTASGQTVGRILDKSGRSNHATQVSAASRPTFRDIDGIRYLEFDGVNDFFVTGNIDFTATDEMSVFVGARKLSDAALGIVVELSANLNLNNGTFLFDAPAGAAANLGVIGRGTSSSSVTNNITAPASFVSGFDINISADLVRMRTNLSAYSTSATDMGTGNFGTYPMYIGRRGGVNLPFNGHLYGLIVRGSLSDAATATATERYLAAKTGVTLS